MKMGLSATVLVLDWVRNRRERLSALVTEAIANGLQRLSLGLGSDCHEWLSVTVWVLIGDGVGTYQRQIRFLSVTVWE